MRRPVSAFGRPIAEACFANFGRPKTRRRKRTKETSRSLRGSGPARARATERWGVRTTNSPSGQPGGEDVDTTNSTVVAKRPARARSDKRSLRATVGSERGRDGSILWGTAGASTSRRQTHRVGNQAVRASRGKLDAWRNQAERASWDGRGGSRNRSPVLVETDSVRGQLWIESVVRMDSSWCIDTMRTSARCVRRIGQPSRRTIGRGSLGRVGNHAGEEEAPNWIIARQRAVIRDREHGGLERRLEISSRPGGAETQSRFFSGETLRTRSARDREQRRRDERTS